MKLHQILKKLAAVSLVPGIHINYSIKLLMQLIGAVFNLYIQFGLIY